MTTAKLIGLKNISGKTKEGKDFAFTTACLVSPMSPRDLERGAVGMDVCTPVVPEAFLGIFNEANIGKDFDIAYYYSNKRTNIGYAALSASADVKK